jgi:hypothetical protein
MEKEEAFSLRQAMADMDIKEEDQGLAEQAEDDRLYQAALNEASELVYQHQNGIKAPNPNAPYRYKQHLRKNSYAHARTASVGRYGDDIQPTGMARDPSYRSFSSSSTSSDGLGSARSRLSYASNNDQSTRPSQEISRDSSLDVVRSKPYAGLAGGPRPMAVPSGKRRSSMKRNISGEVAKPFSTDQIYEEPGVSTISEVATTARNEADVPEPLRLKGKGPLNRVVQFAPDVPPSPETPPTKISKLVSRYEIHRNPPSQSRNPQYTTNTRTERPAERPVVPRKNGVEIRGDDIRQATSMKLKDRSTKLPTPSYVSDSPGRPIVSFDNNWKAPEEDATDEKPDPRKAGSFANGRPHQAEAIPAVTATEDRQQAAPAFSRRSPSPAPQVAHPSIPAIAISEPVPAIPSISVTTPAPAIPIIVLPGDQKDVPNIPIVVTPAECDSDQNIPVIVPPDNNDQASNGPASRRPLPTPGSGGGVRVRLGARARGHWSPAPQPVGSRATARCHECRHPIEGRFVSLTGVPERFHPHCFTCYSCGTGLEALEIHPEPDAARGARLERIRARAAGEILPEEPGETMAEDGDDRLRFFCHLDWHELFAPRCKHCRTPILGEHVVALGAHWHPDHFFCAECGDPFGTGQTHIEKDGYAWCVRCQTRRTERRAPKCKACAKPVIGQYVQALGGEWHDECFRCAVCTGGFDDGQVFPREGKTGLLQIVCTKCRARELKA